MSHSLKEGSPLPKSYTFPDKTTLIENGYYIFPKELEDHELIAFHGTTVENFQAIQQDGFKSAKDLGKSSGLESVSFAKKSSSALTHLMMPRPNSSVVIIAVQFDILKGHPSVIENVSDFHVYKNGPEPTIIGICHVPDDYEHI